MAKKDFSGMLETSITGRKQVVSEETIVSKEQTDSIPTGDKVSELKQGIVINGKKSNEKLPRTIYFEKSVIDKVIVIAKENNLSVSAVINQILKQVL